MNFGSNAHQGGINFSNDVSGDDDGETALVFFKLQPVSLTPVSHIMPMCYEFINTVGIGQHPKHGAYFIDGRLAIVIAVPCCPSGLRPASAPVIRYILYMIAYLQTATQRQVRQWTLSSSSSSASSRPASAVRCVTINAQVGVSDHSSSFLIRSRWRQSRCDRDTN